MASLDVDTDTAAAPESSRWNPVHALRSWRRMAAGAEPEQPEPVIASGSELDVLAVTQFRPAWEIQAYLRFARLPYRVENSGYPGSAATGLYPALTDGQFVLTAEEAAGHIARRRKDLDADLTKEEQAEAKAFMLLVREGLQPLLRVLRYSGDEGEIRHTVHPPMKKALPWPLTWWSPAAEGRRSRRESAVRGLDGLSKSDLIDRAKDLYAALDLRLGSRGSENNEEACFFLGSKPTSLDACVFGHLAEAWTIAGLLDLLPAFDNLSRFFRRVCSDYFARGAFPPLPPPPSDDRETSSAGAGGGGVAGGREGPLVDDDVADAGGGEGSGSGWALRVAMMRADYVNSLNAFNQLPGCVLCSKVPYIEDPYPRRPIDNAGIPAPVLAGSTPGEQAGAAGAESGAAAAAAGVAETKAESLPLKYTALSTVAFLVLSTIMSLG